MDSFIIEILPICLSAMGGAILAMSVFSFVGKANILMDFEQKHFAKKFLNKLIKFEGTFGVVISFLLFFCASAILFGEQETIQLAVILLGIVIAVYSVVYICFWVKNKK